MIDFEKAKEGELAKAVVLITAPSSPIYIIGAETMKEAFPQWDGQVGDWFTSDRIAKPVLILSESEFDTVSKRWVNDLPTK